MYLRARWYAPEQGTFTSRDPFAGFPTQPASLHPYQYAAHNPTRFTDPSGAFFPLVIGGVVVLTAVEMAFLITAIGLSATIATIEICINQQQCAGLEQAIQTHVPWKGGTVTPPLDPGPPEQSVYAGPQLRYPSIEEYMVRSPLTGPEEACWVLPGPMLGAQPWPLTTGAPGEQVQEPLVWMASGDLSLGGVNIDDYGPGTGFSGVYNRGTGHYLLRPSSNDRTGEQIDAGWVARTGGHLEVQNQLHARGLASDFTLDVGFAVIYESSDTLIITFRSTGVNFPNFDDYYPPQDVKDELTAVISRDAPGMTIISMDRYRNDP